MYVQYHNEQPRITSLSFQPRITPNTYYLLYRMQPAITLGLRWQACKMCDAFKKQEF